MVGESAPQQQQQVKEGEKPARSPSPQHAVIRGITPADRSWTPPKEDPGFTVPTTNNVMTTMRDVYSHLSNIFFEGKLVEKIDYIPIEMVPKTGSHLRCCVYKDRAMIRYRIMAALGLHVESEVDETRTLASYAQEALQRERKDIAGAAMTVLEEACNHCMRQQMYVTDACQGCIARPCATNCPKKAITHVNNRAVIDPETCVKCGKCAQVCPYHAIISLPIPCVSACPVGAITPQPDGGKHFDWEKCIYCGACQRACPFGAVMERSQLLDVMKSIADPKQKVVAMVAPAGAGHFGNAPMWSIAAALKKVGFSEVMEVSIGADTTTEEEATEFVHKFGPGAAPQKHPFMTTSCCPAYVRCIHLHAPEIEEAVSHTPTPMHFTAKLAKERWPECTAVFIGPCVAKLQDAIQDKYTDLAMTFMEAYSLIRGRNITVEASANPPEGYECGSLEARRFAVTTGVASAVIAIAPPNLVKPVVIDGLNAAAVKKLKSFAKVPPPGNLVEVMCCEGGCVAGPGVVSQPQIAGARVKALCAKSKHHPQMTQPPNAVNPVIIRGGVVVDK